MNIVSLLPSATEMVCVLGRTRELAGISHSCDHPAGLDDIPVMTSTRVPAGESSDTIDQFVRKHLGKNGSLYHVDFEALQNVRPDVIISQGLCDVCAVSSSELDSVLCRFHSRPALVDLNASTIEDVIGDIERVGQAIGSVTRALDFASEMRTRIDEVARRTASIPMQERPRVAMLEWLHPPFNSGHWTPRLLELAGAIDCLGQSGVASRTTDFDEVLAARPDVILVCLCGLDFRATLKDLDALMSNPQWLQILQQVNGRVLVMEDHALFSRPGPRLINGLGVLAHALHPRIHPPDATYKASWYSPGT